MHAPIPHIDRSISILDNIDPANRIELLSHARTHKFAKGQNVFIHGQPALHLIIMLSGRIKLICNSEHGAAVVIHVANPGEIVLASAVFGDSICPFSGEAMEDTEILCFPARLFRQMAARDNQLSYNLLGHMADNAQQYLTQLNQLNLKSVPQRVGNFLLREFLSTKKDANKFHLPYDKSVIASHLGMQPESFSRALQQLRQNGLEIDRDAVSLPHLFALCDYCDVDTAQRCAIHGTPDCPNPQC